ncbi:protein SMAX1-LIKE 7 [Sesamum alatum]|uniref:Protein SMAX1-LIKE 7 n=1 Tax=Sesamum alatum TaxID=300844 RepID=A0AAE1YN38_9LAMI|nr:protein SMAX1-LIKE 7 [Sesamum alatum]
MPTPVTAARQCLTQEAAAALDEAVAVARRRGHAQTTSLHMVSSLLSLPNSCLREACTRTRNNAYSTRVQFKALELSLSVSLDRLPSSQASKVEEPPVSNSLMAAIKRSQANQRRQPENFTFYQQQQQQQYSSSVPVVKVELQNLILSILDDPLVSRVLGEAGFRSCDIKIATLRPGNSFHPHHLFGYSSRYKRPIPPLFLGNLTSCESFREVGGKAFSFPFMGCFSGDENSRRIGEIMLRAKKRSPLLLGVSAADALRSFLEAVQRNIKGVLPEGLSGLIVVCVRDEILRYLNGDCDEGPLKLRFEEVEKMVESVTGAGVVVNFGELKALAGDGVAIDRLRYLVSNLGRLLEVHGRKLWLIGAAASYDVYFKILNKLPNVEEDWDLEVLPITSFKFSVGGSYPRSSLMESFVPLGGFFSMPPETKSPSTNACQYVVRCHLCNEKYEQEVAALSNGEVCASVAQEYQSSLPSWLQPAEPSAQSGLASVKGKDDRLLLNAKIIALQKKWDCICQQNHFNQTFSKGYSNQFGHQFPRVMGFRAAEDRKDDANLSNHSNELSNEWGNKTMSSSLSTDLRQSSSLKGVSSSDMLSKANNLSILPKSGEIPPDSNGEPGGVKSHHFDSLSASMNNSHTSPTSVTSVTTDLGLGIISASASREPEDQSRLDLVLDLSPTNLDTFTPSISNRPSQSSSCLYHDNHMHSNVKDPKSLYRALVERVGQQEEAISTVVQTITECQTKDTGLHGISRRTIWINIRGPDRLGKKKLGLALAELLYGSRESLIYVDLSFQDEMTHTDALFNSQVTNRYDLTMRGTVVDYLVEKLSKKPSVVFLENIDKADLVVQNSLSQAVKTGRFADLRGREVNISNCIFLGATRAMESSLSISPGKESTEYTEEDILKAKGSSIQMLIRFDLNDSPTSENLHPSDTTRKGLSDLFLMNKRKLVAGSRSMDLHGSLESPKRAHKAPNSYLDLNLPAEGSEICNTCSGESDSDSSSETSRSWLDEFDSQIDQVIFFKPFDFDTLAEKLFKNMNECLQNVVGSECSLGIEPKVMLQLLAAAYLFGYNRVEDWIQHVLGRGSMEAMGKFSLNARSVVKLVTYDGGLSNEQPEGLLPAAIMMK